MSSEVSLECPRCHQLIRMTLEEARLYGCYICPHCGYKWCEE